ncbi:uncharacterized protein LOC133524523 [Cydia pomonella]|uniref:uncharacterized protein LOC133524523 n=1 Tax=Cydia pomonella TaxID=82600 RepID=UPI002ADD7DA2|nr:uncharacterized protein LOC133524523 [Cydia pomonella]XP_061716591.1 uncharacterized protein LOC133524523 [Cydia pomonella]XP_061716592.1 uncharacterized protein LOC133524523 [Cydia pomonella]
MNESFKNSLRHWAIKNQITHVATNELLNILKDHECFDLPADARSLLKTPANVICRVVEPGHYSHIGLEKNLREILKFVSENDNEILLLISIDGLPLFKRSTMEFWPILGSVYNVPAIKSVVFPIGVYCGPKKPISCTSFMEEFISEVAKLINSGLTINGKNIKVAIKGFVCDTPAKSFLLGVKGHTGYYSCTKCRQPGVYLENRMTFPECDATLRTHVEFLKMDDEDFQRTQTPLISVPGINFIKSFPLDYMHLVCLGVVRSLIYIWMFGPVPIKLPRQILNNISADLVALAKHMPLEFNRKPRSLDDVKRWKATEFRHFLLYTGPLVLSKLKSEYLSYYNNFISLTVSMSILLNPEYCFKYNEYARNLLKHFVKTFINLYGAQMATYNLHGLVHLSDDVYEFGALDSCAAFPFENFLQVFKKNIRKGAKPLQQIIKRFGEMSNSNFWTKNILPCGSIYPIFLKPHSSGLLLPGYDKLQQFSSIKFQSFVIKTAHPDSYCVLKHGNIVAVCNIVFSNNVQSMVILCKEFATKENFFGTPLIESSSIGINIVKEKMSLCEKPVSGYCGKSCSSPFS